MLTFRRLAAPAAAVALTGLAASAAFIAAAGPANADVARSSEQWVISQLNLPAAWVHTQGQGVTVAVIDSGVNPSVPDLAGSVISGPDFTDLGTPQSSPGWGVHGTWMASLVAGHGHGTGNGDGIRGAAPAAKVLSLRVIPDSTDPNAARYHSQPPATGQRELASAIVYAVEHKASVISMSLGYGAPSLLVRQALQEAYSHNVVVVAAAGNSGDTAGATGTGTAPYSFPADYPGVLGVAALNRYGQVASFSSENMSVLVAAPGYQVPAEGRDGQYWYVTGTSPACALTAGVVALIKSAYPHLTDAQVISAITGSTTPSSRPSGGWDEQIGFGEVNAGRALAKAAQIAAAAARPVASLAATTHFGGGLAAVPAMPVPPRGPGALVGYGLLGVACLAAVALATSRLLTPAGSASRGGRARAGPARHGPSASGPAEPGMRPGPPPGRPPGPTAGPTQARHAAPRGHGGDRPGGRDSPQA